MLNDSDESLMQTLETRVLSKQPGRIRITDTETRKVIQEYELMYTVWVKLRAGGSRAHAPKLKVRLLSPAHHAAERSIQQQVSTGSQKQYILERCCGGLRSVQGETLARKLDKNKAVNDMVQIVAAEKSSSTSFAKLKEKVSVKRKVESIHDVTEDFKRLKASSVYPTMVENEDNVNGYTRSDVSQKDDKQIVSSKRCITPHQDRRVRGIPLFGSSCPAQQIEEHLCQLWWRKTEYSGQSLGHTLVLDPSGRI